MMTQGLSRLVRCGLLCGLSLSAPIGCSSDPGVARLLEKVNPFSRTEPTAAPAFIAAVQSQSPRYIAAVEKNPSVIALFARQTLSDVSGVGTFIGPDGTQLMFDDGFLVGSRGFGGDVMASDVTQVAAVVKNRSAGVATRLMTLIDGEDRAITRAFKCRITPGRTDPVIIGTDQIMAQTVTEECRGEATSFVNFYWVVPDSGEIIQSSQWAGQVTGKISLRVAPADG